MRCSLSGRVEALVVGGQPRRLLPFVNPCSVRIDGTDSWLLLRTRARRCSSSLRADVLLPEVLIAPASLFDIAETLCDQFIRGETIKPQAPLLRLVEVPIVGGVAEHAGCDDVIEVATIGIALRRQMIPRERQPISERLRTIKAAIATLEVVALVNGEGVAPQGIAEPG